MGVILIFLTWLVSCHAEFADELQGYDKSCLGEDKFLCLDGNCILQEQYCDGQIDCMDTSDESFCPNHLLDPSNCNATSHFLCTDKKKCIPNPWICNEEVDCDDGSDEVNCTTGTTTEPPVNATCKGFLCDKIKCISNVWTCDGVYDCIDKTDEAQELCRKLGLVHGELLSMRRCTGMDVFKDPKHYRCIDSSYCLFGDMMCDGMVDCRDGSDEGPFCKDWQTVCSSNPCLAVNSSCVPERYGFSCICPKLVMQEYNYTTHTCEDVDECQKARPHCSQTCVNYPLHYRCKCDEGYTIDTYRYLCHAQGPEGVLFFTTKNEIGYIKVKSKEHITVAEGIKQAHGVAYDGKYLYWVETAQGHQAIMRAQLESVAETTEVLVGLGLEDPGDVAVDWLGGHIYFSDAERAIISVCKTDGSICTTLPADTKSPRFVTLDVKRGIMYWADWHGRPVIMKARMDGSHSEILVDSLSTFATGLAVDAPNGRLYFVDHTIQAVKLDDKQHYQVLDQPFNHPYAIAVFENTVYWSDWTSRSIQTIDKIKDSTEGRGKLLALDAPVFDMHIYHPVLVSRTTNPCSNHNCSHMCLVSSNTTHTCACPDGMELKVFTCEHMEGFRPQYLVVGGGAAFTRVQYNSLGNPESHATNFNIGWVRAMAYDSFRDTLYVYDGQRKSISSINMNDFTLGVTRTFIYNGLVDVVDMDYDYASDSLYIMDAGKRFIEVVSLKTNQRALVYRFRDMEIPVSFCVMPDYGRMLVAIRESEFSYEIHIDSIGLDGSLRKHLIMNDLKGPRIRLRYAHNMDNVYISDEGNRMISYISPEGTGREHFRSLTTSVSGLSVTDTYVFWTDKHTTKLYWADVHDITHRVRRIEFSIFPNNTQLHIQATSSPPNSNTTLMHHPCLTNNTCSHICVQTPHGHPPKSFKPFHMGYKCLCPPSLLLIDGKCTKLATCNFEQEFYCHKSNECVLKKKKCDGTKDCKFGEDEEVCDMKPIINTGENRDQCPTNYMPCHGKCVDKNLICTPEKKTDSDVVTCTEEQFQCRNSSICLENSQLCDGQRDCPDDSDEEPMLCDIFSCQESEFMCTSGSCVLKVFKCDGEEDCPDGSDEENCRKITCGVGHFQCQDRSCIELGKRCDGKPDCIDHSDEHDCEEPVTEKEEVVMPQCPDSEFACELNASICLPATARCNKKADCPGGTDELNCGSCARDGMFKCKQEFKCVSKRSLCNGIKNCDDGSDETPDACAIVNRTSSLYPSLFPPDECRNGYLCKNGECVEWRQVCDNVIHCFDSSDEKENCEEACNNHTCEVCQPTPKGPRCYCPPGKKLLEDNRSCEDIDECAIDDVCSHNCHNVQGTFLCSCHHGYALRLDRRSCKAIHGSMSILYVSGNSVRSLSADGTPGLQYHDQTTARIADMDADVRRNKILVTLPDAKKLVEVTGVDNNTVVTNIGTPTKVAVDWVTGNVYFVDIGLEESFIRVCNVDKRRCAKLQKLPLTGDAKVTALVVDPGSRHMFYCITRDAESEVWSASLAGSRVTNLATFGNCTGLAVDSFSRKLYLAETGPAQIIRMNFEGEKHQKVIFDHPQLEAPQGLVIFEDWIYFLVANSLKLSRCLLYGKKTCEPYIYRMFDANTFVIRHSSVQRDDLINICDGFYCSNICVMDEAGPQCLCNDGKVSKDGECVVPEKKMLPNFNGWTLQEYTRAHQVSFAIVTTVVVLFIIYLAIFIYFQYKKRRASASNYVEVRFQNTLSGQSSSADPVIEIPAAESSSSAAAVIQEFVNPIQFVRQLWNRSMRRTRPIGTAGLGIDVPNTGENLSDTESDIDDRDSKRIIN